MNRGLLEPRICAETRGFAPPATWPPSSTSPDDLLVDFQNRRGSLCDGAQPAYERSARFRKNPRSIVLPFVPQSAVPESSACHVVYMYIFFCCTYWRAYDRKGA